MRRVQHEPGDAPFRGLVFHDEAWHWAAAVVCVDMLLFAYEYVRVLRPDRVLIRANQLGRDGALFVGTETVRVVLGEEWTAVEAEAGWGHGAVLRRQRPGPGMR